MGPNDKEFNDAVQAKIPSYWEVQSVQIESRGNRGSNTIPQIESRFKASIKLKEDTFSRVENYQLEGVSQARLNEVAFLAPANSKGKEITVYGVGLSQKYQETWKTNIALDDEFNLYSLLNENKPKNKFIDRYRKEAVLIKSAEETALKSKIDREIAAQKQQFRSLLLSKEQKGYYEYPGTFGRNRFIISFESSDPDARNFSGLIRYLDNSGQEYFIREIQGNISDNELSYKIGKVVKGDAKSASGWGEVIYTFPLTEVKYEDILSSKSSYPREVELKGKWQRNGGTSDLAKEGEAEIAIAKPANQNDTDR
jgi:hypothetical protein